MGTYILNIETSTNICSVGIAKNGTTLCERHDEKGKNHAAIITILIQKCLNFCELSMNSINAVALASGPGSYTSLRVGCSTAKGICYAQKIPLIAISTLTILGIEGLHRYPEADYIIPMIDARRMEVYASIFEKGTIIKNNFNIIVEENSFCDIFTSDTSDKCIVALGNGAVKTKSVISNKNYNAFSLECSANFMSPISHIYFKKNRFKDIASFVPNYLKLPYITTPKSRLI